MPYACYADLAAKESEEWDYRVRCRKAASPYCIVAPHGGGIEPGTSEVADAVAGEDHSFYAFEGLKIRGNFALHVTSRGFDEPRGLALVERAHTVLAVHGCGGEEIAVYVGGLNAALRARLEASLRAAGFTAEPHPKFPGTSPSNICNRCAGGAGVQMEITRGLRALMFRGLAGPFRRHPTEVFHRFVAAVRAALEE